MKPDGPLLCWQKPATSPYPEPEESSPHPPAYSQRTILIMSRVLVTVEGVWFGDWIYWEITDINYK
jgi:hypothetical protein